MDSRFLHLLERSFEELLRIEPPHRRDAVRRIASGNLDLEHHLLRLLNADEHAGSLLSEPDAVQPTTVASHLGSSFRADRLRPPGTIVEHYTIMETLGEGGFGIVYAALQSHPVERLVALKISKHIDSHSTTRSQWDSERQSLSRLNHPHIARILDAGLTSNGERYLTMDLVRGQRITTYCDAHHLTVTERINVILQVCDALHHAAELGLAHGDIKPANIIVVNRLGEAQATLIDFGIARLTWNDGDSGSSLPVAATPAYAAPEQTRDHGSYDSRADIYSLACVLHELLIGSPPQSEHASLGPEPSPSKCAQRPSQPLKALRRRLSAAGSDRFLRERSTSRGALLKHVTGDLETLLMHALEHDPALRYQTIDAFSHDLRRFLRFEPLSIRTHSHWYLGRLSLERNRKIGWTALAIVLLLSIATLVTSGSLISLSRRTSELATATSQAISAKDEANRQERIAQLDAYAAHIANAAASLREFELVSMQSALDSCPPPLRNWEWYYLRGRIDDSSETLSGHGARITDLDCSSDGTRLASCAINGSAFLWNLAAPSQPIALLGAVTELRQIRFNQDGSLLATAGTDGWVRVYDGRTGSPLVAQRIHAETLDTVEFSPDGNSILSASLDGTCRVLDARSLNTIHILSGHTAGVRAALFTPDGARIISVSFDKTARIWEATTGMLLATIREHDSAVYRLAVSQDSRLLATGSDTGEVILWNLREGTLIARSGREHTDTIYSLAFDPASTRLLVTARDGTASLWDCNDRVRITTLPPEEGGLLSGAWSSDGSRFATAGRKRSIQVFDADTITIKNRLIGHTRSIQRILFVPESDRLTTCSDDGSVRIWNSTDHLGFSVLRSHTSDVSTGKFAPDGRSVLTASHDNTALVWKLTTLSPQARLVGHTWHIRNANLSHDGTRVVTASPDGSARLWDTTTGECLHVLTGHHGYVMTAVFSPDDGTVLSASYDGTAALWDVDTGTRLTRYVGHTKSLVMAQFNPDGTRVLTASQDGTAALWDTATGTLLQRLDGHTAPLRFASFNHDGSLVATASDDASARIWMTDTGALLAQCTGHEGSIRSLRFLQDDTLLTASDDSTIRRWIASSGHEMLRFSGHSHGVRRLAVHPTLRRLATGSSDGTVRMWDLDSGRELLILATDLGTIHDLNFAPDGSALIAASSRNITLLWRLTPSNTPPS